MHRRLLIGFSVLLLALAVSTLLMDAHPIPRVEASPGWLEGYQYRKKHIITGASGAGVEYQMMFKVRRSSGTDSNSIVYVSDKCKSDFSDVRFTDASGNVFPYAITYLTSDEAWFWIKPSVDLSVNQAIYIYYGNPNAQSESSLDNTFILAEDWSNSTLQPRWTVETLSGSPTITIDTGLRKMTIAAGSTAVCAIRSTNPITFPSSYRVEDFSAEQYSSTYTFKFGCEPGLAPSDAWGRTAFSIHQSAISESDLGVAFLEYHDYYAGGYRFDAKTGVGHNEDKTYNFPSVQIALGYWSIRRNSTNNKMYIECTTWSGLNHQETNTENPNRVYLWLKTSGSFSFRGVFYPFKIRKYVYPEPAHGDWYPEESASTLQCSISVANEPSWLPNGYFRLDLEDHQVPYSGTVSAGTHNLTALDEQIVLNGTHIYNFRCWKKNGAVYSYTRNCSFTIELGESAEFAIVYESYKVEVSTDPAGLNVKFEADGWELTAPKTIYRGPGYHTFKALTDYTYYNSTHLMRFFGWFVNNLYISPQTTLNIYISANATVKLAYRFEEIPAPAPMTFRAQLVTLGEVAPGSTKNFAITVLFDIQAITVKKIEFQVKGDWFTVLEPLPKQASRGMEAIGTCTIQVQLKTPTNVMGYYNVPFIVTAENMQGQTITTASYVTFTLTAAPQITETTLTAGGFMEAIQRLLGNPLIMAILLIMIIWLATYALKKR